MAAIDTSIMNVAIPHLRGVFSATNEEISWITSGYLLSAAIAMPLAAWLGGWFGRRTICQAGLVLFIVSSVICGLAPNLHTLIIARVLQGIGAGILLPVEQAILRETFPAKEQGLAMGLYGVTIMFGPALGPVLGGYIIDNHSWSWVFYINVPIGALGYVMVSRFVLDPPHFERNRGKIDLVGIIMLVVGLGALHFLLERGERLDWFESISNVVLLFVTLGSLAMFVAHEIMTPKPAVNLRVLDNGAFASAIFIGGVVGFVVFATLFLLPIYMQDILGYSATQTGLTLLPRALIMLVAFPIVGALYNKISPRVVIAVGLLLGAYSSVLMSQFDLDTGTLDIIIPQMLQGLAVACILTPLSTVALMHVSKERLGAAAGLNNLVRQLGGSLGVTVFATLVTRFDSQNREAMVHLLGTGDALLRQRLSGVAQYFWSLGGVDISVAAQRSLARLNGRFQEEMTVIAFEHSFAWAAVLFVLLLPLLMVLRSPNAVRLSTLGANSK